MPKGTRKTKDVSVESYSHKGKKRKNNPPVGLVSTATDKLNGRTKYQHDPHIDPQLTFDASKTRFAVEKIIDNGLQAETLEEVKDALKKLKKLQSPYLSWAGKKEGTEFEVQNVSLHIHGKIAPI